MGIQEQIERELQVKFELNEEKTHVVFYETLDYHFETRLTKAQVGEFIEVLAKLRDQMR
mgnify:CR=1 FL=1